jgi:HK97 family phage major capsid protein
MSKPFINPALIELRDAVSEAENILARSEFSKRDEAHFNLQLAKIAAVQRGASFTESEASKRFFRSLMTGEQRTDPSLFAGTQTITYTQSRLGGTLVPQEYYDKLILGMAQYDPLLDENIVTLIKSDDDSLRPINVPGWDLSSYKAVKVGEGQQQNPQQAPTAIAKQLNGYTFRTNLTETWEFNEDTFMSSAALLNVAFQIAFARGIGIDFAIGNGTTAPQGVLTGAVASGAVTSLSGGITADDIENAYFSLDRWYRQSPKCAWVMSDAVYEEFRKAKDSAGRPLISVVKDKEVIMGKPVYVSPSIPATGGGEGIVFGDLSHFVARVSRMSIQRSLQAAQGGADFGKYMYIGRMRADSVVIDPTSGANAPIKYVLLHS